MMHFWPLLEQMQVKNDFIIRYFTVFQGVDIHRLINRLDVPYRIYADNDWDTNTCYKVYLLLTKENQEEELEYITRYLDKGEVGHIFEVEYDQLKRVDYCDEEGVDLPPSCYVQCDVGYWLVNTKVSLDGRPTFKVVDMRVAYVAH